MSKISGNLLYTREHEWVLVEENIATVGISDHAQSELGDVTFVELPELEKEFALGEEAATVESVKASSPIYAPVGGTIVEINNDLDDDPGTLNTDPYGAGWIFKIEIADASELRELLSAEQYEAFLQEEEA